MGDINKKYPEMVEVSDTEHYVIFVDACLGEINPPKFQKFIRPHEKTAVLHQLRTMIREQEIIIRQIEEELGIEDSAISSYINRLSSLVYGATVNEENIASKNILIPIGVWLPALIVLTNIPLLVHIFMG